MFPLTAVDRVDYDISQLLQRFENIVAIAANKFDGTSHVDAAVEAFQIDVESTALVCTYAMPQRYSYLSPSQEECN